MRKSSRFWLLAILTSLVALIAVAAALLFRPFLFATSIEEQLEHPQHVRRWTRDALVLANGTTVRLPGVSELPATLPLLSTLVERGVEVQPNGRVVGLAKIWHWCGNDPVRRHIARVDVAAALLYFGYGPLPAAVEPFTPPPQRRNPWSQDGWRVSEFAAFRTFEQLLYDDSAISR